MSGAVGAVLCRSASYWLCWECYEDGWCDVPGHPFPSRCPRCGSAYTARTVWEWDARDTISRRKKRDPDLLIRTFGRVQ